MDIAADLDFAVVPVTGNKPIGLYRCYGGSLNSWAAA
jgi:hypothetical protein